MADRLLAGVNPKEGVAWVRMEIACAQAGQGEGPPGPQLA